jgi:AmmeMemoRadiSam system protein A
MSKSINQQIESNDRTLLLKLARKVIEQNSKNDIIPSKEIDQLSSVLKEKRGCFVTLTKQNNLRGCIGYILPIAPLYKAVIDNAYSAAFSDPRFPPVSKDEANNLHLEISVLSVPEKLDYNGKEDLLKKLIPLKDGVIIKKGFNSATFLPQVWEQLPKKEDFLGHLCLKAGLSPNEWEKGTLEIEIYHAEVFEEE